MEDQATPQEFLQVIAAIHARGWATGTGGNFSRVVGRDPLRLQMAPSGVNKGSLAADALITVDAFGQVISGTGKASAETLLHLALAEAAGAGAVLHSHSVFATVLSRQFLAAGAVVFEGYEMQKGLAGITTHDTAVHLPILPNSQDMQAVSTIVRQRLHQGEMFPHGLLLAGHGLYAWGEGLFAARRHLEILEFLLEVTYRTLILVHSSSHGPA
jgi:methylthioribulose-1-phosphate dehydratase